MIASSQNYIQFLTPLPLSIHGKILIVHALFYENKKLTNMEQSYSWVMACIESCFSAFQFSCCYTLIDLFEAKYKEQEGARQLQSELYKALINQTIKHSVEV